jgi:hypothetical protein
MRLLMALLFAASLLSGSIYDPSDGQPGPEEDVSEPDPNRRNPMNGGRLAGRGGPKKGVV